MVQGAFYTACVNKHVEPGFIADRVQMGGAAIAAMGNILDKTGYLMSQYGTAGGVLSAVALSGCFVLDRPIVTKAIDIVQNWGEESAEKRTTSIPGTLWLTPIATEELKRTGIAMGAGLGLSIISKPVTWLGNLLQDHNTLCAIGNKLDYFKTEL